ncbi:DNA polymerase Y family protein [Roseomonas sp. CECT 9278]|uniref:Y-family DNA polymerase n=1 Tax=Roseomonas sp. CECT 9278 TaxID=2845823 RepID=UPI001EF9BB4D|nr:DNA polymerase Y family protein [Roseomonas sp. CECT 9278]CAH0229419.1 Protein ImuB [Roseomonas sp. CECT 9278]
MGVGEGGVPSDLLTNATAMPLPLPPPLIAGSGEAVASPAGVQGAAPHGRARRTLALLLPRLPVERLRRPGPVVVWAQRGARRVVVSVSAEAGSAGLRAGQALADAQAIMPGVVLVPEDPAGDAAALNRLALWCLRFTPLVGVEGEDGLLLDITGVAHLFGGEDALRAEMLRRLARQGLTARAAVAGMPGVALALVRGGWGGVVVAGKQEAAVRPLSLAALRLDPALVSALQGLGLRDVGSVAAQPRAGLVRRFGAGLARALDEALGHAARPISPIRPPPEMQVARDFADPVATRAGIEAALDLLLDALCRALREAGRGGRRMLLRAHRVDGAVQEVAIGTGLATRDPQHLARLFHGKLEGLEPECGYDRITLEAPVADPMAGVQNGLGTTGRSARREELAQLLDRLSQRLPVWRLAPRASHWPERAVRRVGAFDEMEDFDGWSARPRPLRLLRRPPFIGAMALLPDAPPSLLRIGREAHRVVRAEGPERFEPEWWRDRADRKLRDYYRVELASGARLWVCRIGLVEPGGEARWALHGHFP